MESVLVVVVVSVASVVGVVVGCGVLQLINVMASAARSNNFFMVFLLK